MSSDPRIHCPRCKRYIVPKLALNRKATKPDRLYCPDCGTTLKDFYNAWPAAIMVFVVIVCVIYFRLGHA